MSGKRLFEAPSTITRPGGEAGHGFGVDDGGLVVAEDHREQAAIREGQLEVPAGYRSPAVQGVERGARDPAHIGQAGQRDRPAGLPVSGFDDQRAGQRVGHRCRGGCPGVLVGPQQVIR